MSDTTEPIDLDQTRGKVSGSHRDRYHVKESDVEGWVKKFDGAAYGVFGDYFSKNRERFGSLQNRLRECHFGISVDLYLSRVTLASVLFSGGLVLLFNLITLLSFAVTGFSVLPLLVLNLMVFPLLLGTSWGIGYLYPTFKARKRGKNIDRTIPHAVTFMYAMSRGGMSFVDILQTLAESEGTYGEVSKEIRPVVRDINFFSTDIPNALRSSAKNSPSEKYTDFADDLVSMVTAGGNLTEFLYNQSEHYLEEAQKEQEKFVETLALLAEIYVTAFVAGPLFLIIVIVVMNMIGGSSVVQLYLIVYGLIPLMNIGFFIFIDTIMTTSEDVEATVEREKQEMSYDEAIKNYGSMRRTGDTSVDKIFSEKKKRERNDLLKDPVKAITENPNMTVYVTGPIALLVSLASIVTIGALTPSAFINEPVYTTFFTFLLPFLLITIPLSFFHERKIRKEQNILKRLPGSLRQLAGSNEIGMTLTEGLQTVANNTSGRLGEEIVKVRNDIKWNHNVNDSLKSFANRIRLPLVSRTVKLITEANQSSSDIAKVLDVASKDASQRQRLRQERSAKMTMYTAVIIMSFVIYLFVIATLEVTFLEQIEQIAESQSGSASEAAGSSGDSGAYGSLQIGQVSVETFRMIFYHSTIIQAIGSGLLAGHLGKNNVYAGLKFTIVLVLLSTVVFAVI